MNPPVPGSWAASPAEDAAVLGIDNVRLELPLAGVGTRILAAVVDYMIFAVLIGVVWTGGIMILALFNFSQGWVVGLLILVSFAVQWSYFAVLEIVMHGQTFGKQVLGLRVVSANGGQPGTGSLVMRNLVRAVDVLFGLPSIAIDRRFRRFGDMAAGTVVVQERPDDDGVVLSRVPEGWGASEIALAESFLRRAELMEEARARRLARRLLDAIRRGQPDFFAAAGPEAGDPVGVLRRGLLGEAA